jgi:lysophospholipase L1-like esterase
MRSMTLGRRAIWSLVVAVVFIATGLPTSAGATPTDYVYVALGDSYTSGPGIPKQIPEAAGCGRSDHNYPHLLALVLPETRFADVSCGGASTENMTQPQVLPNAPLNPPQFDALDADVDLVTLGIGGNDFGFGEVVFTCIGLGLLQPLGSPCRDYFARSGDSIEGRIDAIAPKIAAVLAGIHERAPRARVLVVGYPVILPDEGPGCWPVVPLAFGDVPWLRDLARRLNGVLAATAGAGGAAFVDTYASSIGHDVCQLPGIKWVEGSVPTAPAAAFHPNALGMRNSARQVLSSLLAALLS